MSEEIQNWFKQAKRDLQSAKHATQYKDYYVVSFFSHQAVEKALKALHIKKFKELFKTHDVLFLARKVELPERLTSICKKLNPVYIEARYPDASGKLPADAYTESDAVSDLKNAEEVLKWIETQIKQDLSEN